MRQLRTHYYRHLLEGILLSLSIFVLLMSTFSTHVRAQTENDATTTQREGISANGLGLSVTPPVAYLQLLPGQTLQHEIILKNNGSTAITVTPSLHDFITPDASNRVQIEKTHSFPYLVTPNDTATSMQLDRPYTLPAGATQKFTLNLAIPDTAPDQEFHLTILFSSTTNTDQIGAIGAVVNGSLGSNVVLMVGNPNQARPPLKVVTLNTKKVVDSLGKIVVSPVVENPHHYAQIASGSAELRDWRGQVVRRYQIYPDAVLAFDQRQLRATSNDDNPADTQNYTAAEFSYDTPFLFGVYTFTVTLISPPTGQESSNVAIAQTNILALPWSILLALLAAFFTWVMYITFTRKLPLGTHI